MLVAATPADGRGRVSNPAPRQADPDLPTHPLGGFSVAYLMNRAGIEPPNTMTAIDWRLRAVVRSDNEVRFGDANWLAAQNMATGQATIRACGGFTLKLPAGLRRHCRTSQRSAATCEMP